MADGKDAEKPKPTSESHRTNNPLRESFHLTEEKFCTQIDEIIRQIEVFKTQYSNSQSTKEKTALHRAILSISQILQQQEYLDSRLTEAEKIDNHQDVSPPQQNTTNSVTNNNISTHNILTNGTQNTSLPPTMTGANPNTGATKDQNLQSKSENKLKTPRLNLAALRKRRNSRSHTVVATGVDELNKRISLSDEIKTIEQTSLPSPTSTTSPVSTSRSLQSPISPSSTLLFFSAKGLSLFSILPSSHSNLETDGLSSNQVITPPQSPSPQPQVVLSPTTLTSCFPPVSSSHSITTTTSGPLPCSKASNFGTNTPPASPTVTTPASPTVTTPPLTPTNTTSSSPTVSSSNVVSNTALVSSTPSATNPRASLSHHVVPQLPLNRIENVSQTTSMTSTDSNNNVNDPKDNIKTSSGSGNGSETKSEARRKRSKSMDAKRGFQLNLQNLNSSNANATPLQLSNLPSTTTASITLPNANVVTSTSSSSVVTMNSSAHIVPSSNGLTTEQKVAAFKEKMLQQYAASGGPVPSTPRARRRQMIESQRITGKEIPFVIVKGKKALAECSDRFTEEGSMANGTNEESIIHKTTQLNTSILSISNSEKDFNYYKEFFSKKEHFIFVGQEESGNHAYVVIALMKVDLDNQLRAIIWSQHGEQRVVVGSSTVKTSNPFGITMGDKLTAVKKIARAPIAGSTFHRVRSPSAVEEMITYESSERFFELQIWSSLCTRKSNS